MKNKKFLTIGAAVILSGVLLITSALTGNAASNAYEQFKMLLSEEHAAFDNATVDMSMAISDNGAAVMQVTGNMKVDKEGKSMSGLMQISGLAQTKSFEIYRNENAAIFRLTGSDNWYQAEPRGEEFDEDSYGPRRMGRANMKEHKELREMLLDTMMGDLKDQVVLETANGIRTFSLTLDQGNMPILLQTIFSAAPADREPCGEVCDIANLPEELKAAMTDMKAYKDVMAITEERKLDAIKISLSVDENNQPSAMGLIMNVSGKDKDGNTHNYSVDFSMSLSNINSTTPDQVNVDPSSIITLDTASFENCRGFRMHR